MQLSLGGLTSFAVYSGMVGLGFSGIASLAGKWAKARAAAEKISQATRPCTQRQQRQKISGAEASEGTDTKGENKPSHDGMILSVDEFRGEIRFEDVWFSYSMEPQDQHVFENQVEAGVSAASAGEVTLADGRKRTAADASGGIFGVSFTLQPGELLALAGHSGCGKTTILRLLTKELTPQKGAIYVDGKKMNRG